MSVEQVKNPDIWKIAKVCHEVNRAYCTSIGDDSQVAWEEAPRWQQDSMVNGVKFRLDNPDATPEDMHNNWLKVKVAEGWKLGPRKSDVDRIHPCLMPYDQLPHKQRIKDYLSRAVVDALK